MRGAVRGASLAGLAAAVAVLASLAANAATSDSRWPGVLDRIRQQPWWWVAGLAAAGVLVAVVMAWRQERGGTAVDDPAPPPPETVPDWVVDRAERARTVKAVCRTRGRGRAVAITTSLEGAGGFGKTVLARAVAASPRVRRHFRGRIYVVTIGRDVRGRAAVAAKVAAATAFVTGDTTAFDDPGLAGDHLGRLLERRPRTLLVLDDVWDAEQLDPFLRGGDRCVRLVTTRVPGALPRGTERVRVDQMSPAQARAVLTRELPALPEALVRDLLEATGRWALLLRLTNRLIIRRIATGADPADTAAEALRALAAHGPAAVDADPAALDLDDPARRAQAVRATVEAARSLLPRDGAQRLAELAVFAEDESIPVPLIARLWATTGGLTEDGTRALCGELDRLSLVSLTPDHGGRITIHDVLRDYLYAELGEQAATTLHGSLADSMGSRPWDVHEDLRGYVLDHAVEHLLAAGRTAEAERVAGDLRWIEARLHQRGPLAPWADLSGVPTGTAARLADDLTRTAHLLTPTDPPELLTHVLHGRLESLPQWRDRVAERRAVAAATVGPHLRNRNTPPDLPEPALLRTFHGHTAPVSSVAVAADGSLVTIGADGMARGLDPDSGGRLTVDVRGPGRFRALATTPDGRLIATGAGRTVHFWTPDRATPPTRRLGPVGDEGASLCALALSPDGTRLVTVADDGVVETWDAATGEWLDELRRGFDPVRYTSVAFSPDGAWLVIGGPYGAERLLMDHASGALTVARGPGAHANAVVVAPDGRRLAYVDSTGHLEIWDPDEADSFGSRHWVRAHGSPGTAVAMSPDGRWLASGCEQGTIAVWDAGTLDCRARFTGHPGRVHALAFMPDGDRLISAGQDGTVRVWDTRGSGRPEEDDGGIMRTVTVVEGGRRLAVGHGDGRTRLCDPAGDTWSSPLGSPHGDHRGPVAFAPDGRWYAVCDGFDSVRITLRETPQDLPFTELRPERPALARALAIAPDGTWLAVADSANRIELWDWWDSRRITSLPGPGEDAGRAGALVIAPDGTWLAVLCHRALPEGDGEESRVWATGLGPGRRVTSRPVDIRTGDKLTALTVTPDGTGLLTASTTGTVTLWDPRTGAELSSFTDPDGPVHGLSVSPDGTWIATAGAMLRVWDAATARTVAGVRAEAPLTDCAWLPDGRGLVAVGERGLYAHEFRP
ncbi:NB-ARC domain-containing protein [Streptomyces sp. NPDC101191]|uniref:NB-ARC domain-containing protein n=1 Tax=Streptomyces sp. NPDC101191 TaxID=3366126 RepID=UPI00382ACE7D